MEQVFWILDEHWKCKGEEAGERDEVKSRNAMYQQRGGEKYHEEEEDGKSVSRSGSNSSEDMEESPGEIV